VKTARVSKAEKMPTHHIADFDLQVPTSFTFSLSGTFSTYYLWGSCIVIMAAFLVLRETSKDRFYKPFATNTRRRRRPSFKPRYRDSFQITSRALNRITPQYTVTPTDLPCWSSNEELTPNQCILRTLYVGIWTSNRHLEPLCVATGLDTFADANFINLSRLNELGFSLQDLKPYTGSAFHSACGGKVYPIAQITLKWHNLSNPSIDYRDDFLVVESEFIGATFGIKTIENRVIYQRGPSFKVQALKPLNKSKPFCIVLSCWKWPNTLAEAEKELIEKAKERRVQERAGRLDEMRAALTGPSWSEWRLDERCNEYYRERRINGDQIERQWASDYATARRLLLGRT
jgi:hypothetical protein